MSQPQSPSPATVRLRWFGLRRASLVLVLALAAYWLFAYVLAPDAWRAVERRQPALASLATRTATKDGIPADPINVALYATQDGLSRALIDAGWEPADPVTFKAALRIAADSVVHRPYDTAPVSGLYYAGRRQDLAFEQMIGGDPRRRHHVRLWNTGALDGRGRTLWVGAATYDVRAGVSHLTGQITHHIDGAIDEERDKLLADLQRQAAATVEWVDAFQSVLRGRNGGGDPYYTDGRLALLTLQ